MIELRHSKKTEFEPFWTFRYINQHAELTRFWGIASVNKPSSLGISFKLITLFRSI
ncbi:MAG: hypothetical protein ACXVH2_03880 [Methanobacterium sp.]